MRFASARLAVLVILLALVGCDSVGSNEAPETVPRSVIVASQGNFGDGNGSITVYNPETEMADVGAIASLGSIIQSVEVEDDKLYVMSNSGGRIDVFDVNSLEQVEQITDVVSPRYMLVDGSTGYVTSLYSGPNTYTGGLVTIIDLEAATKVTEIPVGDHPEGLALVGSRLYVADFGFGSSQTVSVIDTDARAVVDTIDVGCDGPRYVAADDDDDVFVFCTGRTIYDGSEVVDRTNGAVRILDGETGDIVKRIAVDGQISTPGPAQDGYHVPEDDVIFVVKDSETVLVFDTDTNTLEEELGPFEGQPLSAVAYDPAADRLYLGRSAGYTQAGEVSIHDRAGAELSRFSAGIIPGHITFLKTE